MSLFDTSPCNMCGKLTINDWDGYCEDCNNYFETVNVEQQIGIEEDEQAGLSSRPIIKEIG